MSDGKEVRWYWFRVNDSGAVFMDEDFDGGYVEFTYHDREMAKNSQLQREAYDAIRERDKQIAELRAEVERLRNGCNAIAPWMSAAGEDPKVCKEMKADIDVFFAAIEQAEGEKG